MCPLNWKYGQCHDRSVIRRFGVLKVWISPRVKTTKSPARTGTDCTPSPVNSWTEPGA